MKLDFLYRSGPLTDADLEAAEQVALAGDSRDQQLASRLLVELRRVRHELADPAFMYAGSRIHRHALICRDAENSQLRAELNSLKTSPAPLAPKG